MPISDASEYSYGHFKRVYDYIIKPACKQAGFIPVRADDIKGTNVIVIDILRRIIESDMALCDLSSKNPNVLYELGIRQSFDLPVTFIKDDLTDRVFDIQGFRDIPYSSSLRVDEVSTAINSIADSLRETYSNKGKDVNSIIELLGISKATLKEPISISSEGKVLLDAMNEIRERISSLNPAKTKLDDTLIINPEPVVNAYWDVDSELEPINIKTLAVGDFVEHNKLGIGKVISLDFTNPKELKGNFRFSSFGEKVLLLSYAKLKKRKPPMANPTAP
jgi:hypothetical protein